ADEHSSS
ncbi:chorismate synthase, partial [Chlamydia psittaci C1/97]